MICGGKGGGLLSVQRHSSVSIYISAAQQPKYDLGSLISGVSRARTHTHTYHPLGFLWTTAHLVAGAANTTHNNHKKRTSIPSAGFEPATPVIERPKTYALDHTAAGIRQEIYYHQYYNSRHLRP